MPDSPEQTMPTSNDRHDKSPSPPDKILAPPAGETSTPPLHDNDRPSADARSGTGQRTPHHGFADADAENADDASAARTSGSHQSGGTRQDREQRDEERKQRDGGAGAASSPQGGADPAPGAPATRGGS